MVKKIAIGLLVLVLLLVGGVAAILFTIDLDAVVEEQKQELSAEASKTLGRELTLGKVTTSVFPTLEAKIETVELAGPPLPEGAPEGTEPSLAQASVGLVEVKIDLWRAITSMGEELHVDEILVRGLTLRVARDKDGVWDFSDIQEKLAQGPDEPEPEKPKDDKPADLSFLRGARLSRAALENARIEVDDHALGRPLAVEAVDLELTDIELGNPIAVALKAVFVDGANKTPISVDVEVAELREDLSFDPVPDTKAKVKMGRLDLSAWGSLLPKSAIRPSTGELELDLAATATRGLAHIEAKGFVEAHEVVLAQKGAKGLPLSMKITVDADADTDQGPRVAVRSLVMNGTGLDVAAKANLKGTSAAGLKNADVKVEIRDLGRLIKVVPSTSPLLPPELTLAGPIEAHVKGNTKALDIGVDLDRARVAWADAFDKKKDRPLHLKMKGENKGSVIDVPSFELVVDAIELKGKLGLPVKEGAPLSADVGSGTIAVATLKELLPPVRKALGKGKKVDGSFQLDAKAKAVGDKQDAEVALKLMGLDVHVEGLVAKGSGNITASAHPAGEKVTLKALAELDGLMLKSKGKDGKSVLDKPAGMPLRLDALVVQSPTVTQIDHAHLTFGKTKISAKGNVQKPGTPEAVLALDFGKLDVDFDDVRRTVPGAAQLPKGGSLQGAVKVGGNPERMGTLAIDVDGLDLKFGKSRIKGDIDVKNLENPQLDVALSQLKLAFNDLRPLHESLQKNLPKGGKLDAKVNVKGDVAQMSTLVADANIKELVYGKANIKGTLSFKNLDRPNFAFDLSSPYLNIDELLGEDDKPAKKKAKKKKEPESERTNPHGLEPEVREQLAKVSGTGKLRVKKAIFSDLTMTNFVGDLVVTNGVVKFKALDFTLYQGRISAAGTELDLVARHTGYNLNLSAKNLNLGQAIDDNTDYKKIVAGRVSQSIKLKGRGLSKDDLVKTLSGNVQMNTNKLSLTSLDLLGPIGKQIQGAAAGAGPLASFAGFSSNGKKGKRSAPLGGGTTLKDLQAFLKFDNGKYALSKPLKANTPFGALALQGGGKLDGSIALDTIATLNAKTINQALGANLVKQSVAVPLKVGGTWDKPRVTGIDASKLLESMAGSAAGEALANMKKQAEEEARKLQEEAQRQAAAAQAEAEKRAAQAKAEAEKRAKQAKDEAEKRAKQAKAEAEKRANQAKKEAEKRAAEAKKKADEQRKKAEREAKKRAAEAKKKAEREAKKKAEELKKKAKGLLGF